MSITGIQGLPLEVTVVGCCNLDDKEWISRQDPYVCLEYGITKYRTKICTDGGKNPTFQEKFVFPLIEGLRELNIVVWNSHTLIHDEFIGSGRIQLQKALSQGFDDAAWPLQGENGRHSGEIRLILHYLSSQASKAKGAPSAPQYATPSGALSQVSPPGSFPQASPVPHRPTTAPSPCTAFLPTAPAQPAGYPTQTFHPAPGVYPPQPYPPPPQTPTHYPPGPPSGTYPPPPY